MSSAPQTFFTKSFFFSSSFSRNNQVHGHNFCLRVTVAYQEDLDESWLEKQIESHLISKVHSRDLGENVDFFHGIEISDATILKIFSDRIAELLRPLSLAEVCLERDKRTQLTLSFIGAHNA